MIKKNEENQDSRGFTLLEIMIAVVIASIIVYAIFIVMRTSDEQLKGADVKMAIQDSAREGLYKMMQEIRLSAPDYVTVAADGSSLQFSVPDEGTPLGADYRVDWANAHIITYSLGGLNNRQMIRTDTTSGETTVVANDLTSLSFAGDSVPPEIITVTLGLQRALTNNRQITATPLLISAKAELRND